MTRQLSGSEAPEQEMEEWKHDHECDGDVGEERDVDVERLLHDEDPLNDDGGSEEEEESGGGRRSIRSTVWIVLMVISTLNTRRVLRQGFREYFPVLK
jgi:hypothetical protein